MTITDVDQNDCNCTNEWRLAALNDGAGRQHPLPRCPDESARAKREDRQRELVA
jgi:hypothetical protein